MYFKFRSQIHPGRDWMRICLLHYRAISRSYFRMSAFAENPKNTPAIPRPAAWYIQKPKFVTLIDVQCSPCTAYGKRWFIPNFASGANGTGWFAILECSCLSWWSSWSQRSWGLTKVRVTWTIRRGQYTSTPWQFILSSRPGYPERSHCQHLTDPICPIPEEYFESHGRIKSHSLLTMDHAPNNAKTLRLCILPRPRKSLGRTCPRQSWRPGNQISFLVYTLRSALPLFQWRNYTIPPAMVVTLPISMTKGTYYPISKLVVHRSPNCWGLRIDFLRIF